jgi:hypothetical protein
MVTGPGGLSKQSPLAPFPGIPRRMARGYRRRLPAPSPFLNLFAPSGRSRRVDALDVVCPKCRAAAHEPCAGAEEAHHRERELAALALSRRPPSRGELSAEARTDRAARARQRARARDPRMNNDW